jgi:uncharacterized protein (TIGR03083 family)
MAMAKVDVWPTIEAERGALAADLESLDDAQWETRSLCEEWSVREVVAHMTATSKVTVPGFFKRMITSGFSLERVQAKDIATERGSSPADTLARFKAQVSSTKHPPGPIDSWLGEVIVHAEDVRRPLGISHQYSTAGAQRVADFYKSSNLVIGAKRRIAGLRLQATDVSWSHGDGPEVAGPMVTLVMAMTGRKAVLADLTGEGVATLTARS